MQNVVFFYDRRIQSYLRRTLGPFFGRKLFMLSPKQTGDVNNLWRFGVLYKGKTYILGKGVKSRDMARAVAKERFGVSASECRPKKERLAA